MWAVSEMLDNARDVIFIMVCAFILGLCDQRNGGVSQDWWLTPELYFQWASLLYCCVIA